MVSLLLDYSHISISLYRISYAFVLFLQAAIAASTAISPAAAGIAMFAASPVFAADLPVALLVVLPVVCFPLSEATLSPASPATAFLSLSLLSVLALPSLMLSLRY